MSLADRWGLPRTRGKRRRRAVVDDVSDSSDDDATSDDDEDTETPPNVAAVLAAHLSLGWKLDSSDCLVPPRRPGSSAGHTPELVEMRRAYGIDPGNKDDNDDDDGRKDRPSDAALSALMAALSCARLCGAVLKRADYCAVALEEASKQAARFRRDIDKMRRTGVIPPWSGRPSPEDEMLASVKAKLADAGRELGEDVHRASSPFGSSRDDPDPTLAAAIAAMGGGKKAGPSSSSSLAPVAAVRVAVALDDAMYALAYHGRSCGWAGSSRSSWRPNPALYLNAVTASHAPGATVGSIAAAVRDVGDEWLDAIRRSRMEEGTYLLTAKNLPSPEDVLASGEKAARTARTKTKDGTPPPPPCPELVQLWRDSCRVWPCRLFAFAAPTRRALATLAKFSKRWVEIGAGLGYWAHMMERVEGIDVVALDKTPSPVAGTDAVNEYHGRAMSFCTVTRAARSRCANMKTADCSCAIHLPAMTWRSMRCARFEGILRSRWLESGTATPAPPSSRVSYGRSGTSSSTRGWGSGATPLTTSRSGCGVMTRVMTLTPGITRTVSSRRRSRVASRVGRRMRRVSCGDACTAGRFVSVRSAARVTRRRRRCTRLRTSFVTSLARGSPRLLERCGLQAVPPVWLAAINTIVSIQSVSLFDDEWSPPPPRLPRKNIV